MRNPVISLFIKRSFHLTSKKYWNVHNPPHLDFSYLCNKNNLDKIDQNIKHRKGVGNIQLVQKLKCELDDLDTADSNYENVKDRFYTECKNIPNQTHPDVTHYGDDLKIVKYINEPKQFEFKAREFHEIGKRLNLIRTEHLGYLSGSKSYYLLGELAELEHALIQYTLNNLIQKKFKIVTVPDVLHRDIIESCGQSTSGDRTQVYQLDQRHGHDLCLSGTSEMALAGFLANKVLATGDLPLKLAAISRCFRAETSSIADEKGIYRVHEFTKVEIFVATKPENSDNMLEEIRKLEEDQFSDLGLHLRSLDMPPHELGASAYRKYDVEAWMPGRQIFGEISSCSNCTSYQSRRLNIKYDTGSDTEYIHTLNGTACAIPRMLIALIETYQNDNGTITVPHRLRSYFRNKEFICRQKKVPELRLIKFKK